MATDGGAVEDDRNKAINLYEDPRVGTPEMPETIITCLSFIKAVEDEKYGFRWECPNNGIKCQYRHMLPEGYTLTSKKEREAARKQAEVDAKNARTMEEDIEEERAALKSDGLTPVNAETFAAWKEKRAIKKLAAAEANLLKSQESAAAKRQMTKGKNSVMSGRALFSYNPDMFKDQEGAADLDKVDQTLFETEEAKEEEEVDFD